ncbi:hypothetical protein BXZ70DRAFT_679687 [Cristinia sonorae]|uniref:Phosphatidate phosphatase APP1 catalytic domain-containing protein n=1 Tax=Cristinia sonorae TaxID=1940300 RepID=A0A8K0XSL5_9AGAR|nr:hypothetical protein BXZ70DRAFT_679687 [Cristinia sonorae]
MSESMPSTWRALASSAGRTIKAYAKQRDARIAAYQEEVLPESQSIPIGARQSWSQWAGQKIRDLRQSNDEGSGTVVEKLSLFPGWAARRYREPTPQSLDAPFDIEVFVSGYASRFSGPGFGTRSGRAFLRLAKTYASLPKLIDGVPTVMEGAIQSEMNRLSRSAGESPGPSQLPQLPDELAEDNEIMDLENKLRQLAYDSDSERTASSTSSTPPSQSSSQPRSSSDTPPLIPDTNHPHQWHANLEQRLYPFWASVISNRTLRVSIYAVDPTLYEQEPTAFLNGLDEDEYAPTKQPIATIEVTTATDGSFQGRFFLEYEKLCVHPGAVHIVFGDPGVEHELYVSTQLMPAPSRPSTPTSAPPASEYFARALGSSTKPVVTAALSVPLSHTSVRVISDIDDTVKMSGILQGARAAFRNVFVKDLGDGIIPGMADWYDSMWKRGVRFHYVSNGPFELLPIVNEFIQLSRLPPGSVRLRSYAGRSLFNGILSAPAGRKRAAIKDVLESFSDARFFLVGDSGEQDLELYAAFAKERPKQILGIFIRDAHNSDLIQALDDPTGEATLRANEDLDRLWGSSPPSLGTTPSSSPKIDTDFTPRRSGSKSISEMPTPRAPTGGRFIAPFRRPNRALSEQISSNTMNGLNVNGGPGLNSGAGLLMPYQDRYSSPVPSRSPSSTTLNDSPMSEESGSYFSPPVSASLSSSSSSSQQQPATLAPPRPPSRSSTLSSMIGGQPMTEAERKRYELQSRVNKARAEIPSHIPLRVFRDPAECIEAARILNQLNLGKKTT